MVIFLARIPQNTTQPDIISFLNPVLKGGFFTRKGMIKSLEIMLYQDSDAEMSPYYCLVRIEPDSVAKRVINKLNRKPLNGKRIAVREYQLRSWHNDPRMINKLLYTTLHQDRRANERRSHKLAALATCNKKISNDPVIWVSGAFDTMDD